MNIAVILAGGSGNRLGSELPKQFLKVAGKKLIEHTIDVFENNEHIDEIAIVSREDYIPQIEQIIIDNHYRKVSKVLCGGKERYHSSLSAIAAYTDDEDNLIFHDAVRPLVNDRIIDDCITALDTYEAVDVAIKATDTIIQVDGDDCISNIPPRAELRNGQTPQCFKRGIINEAYRRALSDPMFATTDDCGVVRRYMPEIPVKVVRGEVFNMKITYMEDLFLLDKLFQLKQSNADSREVTDVARRLMPGKVIVVFGGSYGIGEEIVRLAEGLGAKVYSFSRSKNGVDVSNVEQVREALASVARDCGHIDYVVNTAGILIKQPLYAMSYEKVWQSLDVNYKGVVIVAKESYEYLRRSKGSLLFFTSSSYTRGRMMYSIYSSTKAAIVNICQALAEEWFAQGIRVNCINPERTKTPMREQAFGIEPEGTLLDPRFVAIASVNTLTGKYNGEVIDVKR